MAAVVPADRLAVLQDAPRVTRVWSDVTVQTADSADPGIEYAAVSGGEAKPAGFDLANVAACDGDRDGLGEIAENAIDPFSYQSYTFAPALDPDNPISHVELRFVFKEKGLNQARLEVYQVSTRTWHPFEIDTTRRNHGFIDTTFDLTDVLQAPEDLADIQVRFSASVSKAGRNKAEVDCVNLHVTVEGGPETVYAPASGADTRAASFDLDRTAALDGAMEKVDFIPFDAISPYAYQSYIFAPAVDPDNLPELVDLRLVFKE